MKTRFVCLANSYKEGGRCLAGVVLDKNNKPIKENGRFKWIRPVSNTPHGVVPGHLVAEVEIPDIFEIEITKHVGDGYQSENVLFNFNSIRKVDQLGTSDLVDFCEEPQRLFGNTGKSVSEAEISQIAHSLLFICVNNFAVVDRVVVGKQKLRLVFSYKNQQYDLPITDPDFIYNYRADPDYLEDVSHLFLTLSLAIPFTDGLYYKLVAGIVPYNKKIDREPIDDLPF